MCRPTEEGDGPTICVPWSDDTPLESVARNNISCIWYPFSMLFSPPIIALPSFCDRISCDSIPTRASSLFPCSVFVFVLNPQVSFNSPSISKNRCGQGYGLALGSWFLYQRHFREATNIRISRSRPFEQNPSNGLGCSVCFRVDVANVSSISRDRSVPQALPFSLAVLRRSSCSVAEGGCVLIIITVGLPFGRRLVSPTSFHSFLCVRDCWSTHEKTSSEGRDMFFSLGLVGGGPRRRILGGALGFRDSARASEREYLYSATRR